ncbi:MAG: LytTR family DNA-binding domain-containing protein [Bacteroidales bacterium]|nr:LytTR family DNA-binding domain-containing protein [Bacteroidales bacterium]
MIDEKIGVVIIEDEAISYEIIKRMIQNNILEVEILGHAASCKEGIKLIKEVKPDLVFLDIQMEDGTGFTLLEAFENIDFQVVFVTSYNQYAINAIKCSALDYILKPIALPDLKAAIRKYQSLEYKINNKIQHSTLIQNIKSEKKVPKKIIIPSEEEYLLVSPNDIVRLYAEGHHTIIVLADEKKMKVTKSLKEFEQLLEGANFARIHNTHLINVNFVKSYLKNNGGEVLMEDGVVLPVSRRRKAVFMNILTNM